MLIPGEIAAESYKKAVESAIQKLRDEEVEEDDEEANDDGNKVTKPSL